MLSYFVSAGVGTYAHADGRVNVGALWHGSGVFFVDFGDVTDASGELFDVGGNGFVVAHGGDAGGAAIEEPAAVLVVDRCQNAGIQIEFAVQSVCQNEAEVVFGAFADLVDDDVGFKAKGGFFDDASAGGAGGVVSQGLRVVGQCLLGEHVEDVFAHAVGVGVVENCLVERGAQKLGSFADGGRFGGADEDRDVAQGEKPDGERVALCGQIQEDPVEVEFVKLCEDRFGFEIGLHEGKAPSTGHGNHPDMWIGCGVDEIGQMRSGRAYFCGRCAAGFTGRFVGAEQDVECGTAPGGVDAENALILAGQRPGGIGAKGAATGAAFASAESNNCGAIRVKRGTDVIQDSLSRRGKSGDQHKLTFAERSLLGKYGLCALGYGTCCSAKCLPSLQGCPGGETWRE